MRHPGDLPLISRHRDRDSQIVTDNDRAATGLTLPVEAGPGTSYGLQSFGASR